MSDRIAELVRLGIRPMRTVLEENAETLQPILDQTAARLSPAGTKQMIDQIEQAYAAGEPGLLDQQRPNYVTEEALVRSWAASFGQIVLEGDEDNIPEFTYMEPSSVRMITVALSRGQGRPRGELLYEVTETPVRGSWKEIQTEPVEIRWPSPIFKRRRALLESQANDESAYQITKYLDNLSFAAIGAALKTTFASTDKVWTKRDLDVVGLPAGNDATSTLGFWPTLRTKVIPYFQGVRKADRVINIHILHTDLQYLYAVAGIGTQSLGQYTDHQAKVYEGNISEITIYGHRFRIIPENWNITTGQMYCTVGPAFKMWLPPNGNQAYREARGDGSMVFSLSRIYEILSPSTWWSNLYRTTWSITDTTA